MPAVRQIQTLNDHDLLIHIATQMETLIGNGQPGRCAWHSTRISRLEAWQRYMAGAIAVIILLLTIGGPIVLARLK